MDKEVSVEETSTGRPRRERKQTVRHGQADKQLEEVEDSDVNDEDDGV